MSIIVMYADQTQPGDVIRDAEGEHEVVEVLSQGTMDEQAVVQCVTQGSDGALGAHVRYYNLNRPLQVERNGS